MICLPSIRDGPHHGRGAVGGITGLAQLNHGPSKARVVVEGYADCITTSRTPTPHDATDVVSEHLPNRVDDYVMRDVRSDSASSPDRSLPPGPGYRDGEGACDSPLAAVGLDEPTSDLEPEMSPMPEHLAFESITE